MSGIQNDDDLEWSAIVKREHWKKAWDVDDIGFHQAQVHEDLVKHRNIFSRPNCRVYIPLCGKSVDLVYLANLGCDVVGCEFVEKAIKDFFDEQKLEYTITESTTANVVVYKAVAKKITLYLGDFFAVTSSVIGKFDAIWDRGGLVAINEADQEAYAKVVKDLMAPKCCYLVNLMSITGKNYAGPPHSFNEEAIEKLFGKFCEIKQVEATQYQFDFPNVESMKFLNMLLTPK